MDTMLSANITAKDGASKTFLTVGKAADTMGDVVERAGKDGAKGMDQLGKAAQTNARSLDGLRANATALGAVFGTMAGGASLAGAAYRDQQREIDGLRRLYGEAADDILAMSERIQENTRYSNDAARQSALLASSLSTNYGLSADQIDMLIQRSADLAQIHGFTLPDAVQRTAGALRGEGEAAEALGLNMSDAAIAAAALDAGITNWGVPGALSESEKAAFRFKVLMEATGPTVGAAADAADNAGGRFRQFFNSIDDGAEAVGRFLGPVGQIAAEMAPIAVALPVVSAGAARLGPALRGSSLAMGALGLATNPVALGIGAIVAVGGFAVKSFLDQKQAAESYELSLGNLGDTIEILRRRGDTELAALADSTQASVEATKKLLESFTIEPPKPTRSDDPFDTTYAAQMEQYEAQVSKVRESAALATPVLEKMNEALRDPNIDVDAYLAWANGLLTAAAATEDTADDILALQTIMDRPLSDFSLYIDEATESMTAGGAAAREFGANIASGMAEAASAAVEAAAAQALVRDAQQEWLASGANIIGFLQSYGEGMVDLSNGATQAEAAWLRFKGTLDIAEDLAASGAAMDQVLRTFEQVDALGQRYESGVSIADALIGEPGVWAEIDNLLQRGRISQEEYTAAVGAGVDIQTAAGEVTSSLNTIRAKQIPLLAEEAAAYQDNIRAIAELGPAEQRRALMLQDSGVQAQIATLYSQAYAASVGEIPEEVATSMILNAAEADAGLKDLLIQLGLISETETGLKVNFPDGDAVTASIDRVTLALLEMQAAADGAGGLQAYDIAVNIYGKEEADELFGKVDKNDGRQIGIQANFTVGDGTGGAGNAGGGSGVLDKLLNNDRDTYAFELAVRLHGQEEAERMFGQLDEADGKQATMHANVVVGDGTGGAANAGGGSGSATLDALIEDMAWFDNMTATGTVVANDLASEPLARVVEQAGSLNLLPPVTIAVGAEDMATGVIEGVQSILAGFSGRRATAELMANDAASGVIGAVTGALGAVDGRQASTSVVGYDLASGVIGAVSGALGAVNGATANTYVFGDSSDSVGASNAAAGAVGAVNGNTANTYVYGDSSDSVGASNAAAGAIGAVDGNSANTYVYGDNSDAMGSIGAVAAYDGAVLATSYIDIVTRNYQFEINRGGFGPTARHGGIPGYAGGGVIVELAEAGPEVLHFAGGGTALVPDRGLYDVPPNTYVSPSNANPSVSQGDRHYHFHNHGTIVGTDDFREQLMTEFAGAIATADDRHLRGLGATS